MATYETVAGPIQLYDKEKNSERTAPQVITYNTYDSRIYQQISPLTYTQIRELRKDPTIQLARWAVLSPMIHTPWTYVSYKDKATKEMLDFVEDCLSPLRDWFLQQAVFGTLDYGWQPFEVVYKPEDGAIRIDNFKALLQDLTTILVYIDSGQFAGFVNQPWFPGNDVQIKYEYALNINFEVEGTDWYGTSVFSILEPIQTSWDDVEETANRYDRKMAGANWVVYYPVGKTPYQGVETANDEIALALLNRLQASGAVAIPDEIQEWMDDTIDREAKGKWRVELLSSSSSVQSSFIDRQKYLDALKMRAFGLPERSILEGKHGTKEEADAHGDIALSIIDSRHRLLCNQLNVGPVSQLLSINFGKKYRDAVRVIPAPLVDAQYATIKEIYRLILQTPDSLVAELPNINTKAMRDELGIPSLTDSSAEPVVMETTING